MVQLKTYEIVVHPRGKFKQPVNVCMPHSLAYKSMDSKRIAAK